jgi:carboxyl-terminal processing protease
MITDPPADFPPASPERGLPRGWVQRGHRQTASSRRTAPRRLILPRIVSVLCGLLLAAAVGEARALEAPSHGPPPKLAPLARQSSVAQEIISHLNRRFVRPLDVDDELSQRVFTRYLDELDEARLYFTAADINSFAPLRLTLDDALERGDLEPAFRIFNVYQQRVAERQRYVLKLLDKGLSSMRFTADERLELDRKHASWPRDRAELDDVWRRRIKGSVLDLKLAGKSDAAIVDLLRRRYRSQLNLVWQRNTEDAFRTFMSAFTQSYDPHTRYLSPRLSENFNIQMSLSLEGIGAILEGDNEYVRVVRLVPGGPADKSGLLQPGHRIVGVGQGNSGPLMDVVGWRLDDVVDLIRGPRDTQVRLELIAPKQESDHPTTVIQLTRGTVALEDQAARKKIITLTQTGGPARTVGLIEIPSFYVDFKGLQAGGDDYRSTVRDVRRLVEELKEEGIDGLVIDLRDNGGGALQEATQLVGLFITTGPTVQVRGANGKVTEYRDTDAEMIYDGPLAVLVNRMSASASEIFAAAIQDYGRGLIIGESTFGKGSVQQMVDLKEGQLKLTTAMFYRISGRSTQRHGVIPDVRLPEVYDPETVGEEALEGALPPDQVEATRFVSRHSEHEHRVFDWLQHQHGMRVQQDPELTFLVAGLDHVRETRSEKSISLREETRRRQRTAEERWRLAQENKRRVAKGLAPVKQLTELENEAEDKAAAGRRLEVAADPLQTETGRILVDFIGQEEALAGGGEAGRTPGRPFTRRGPG